MSSENNHLHVLGFAGSLRQRSYNRALLRAAQELLPEGMTLEIFDLTPLPFFNADVEAVAVPEPVLHFRQRLKAADALLIATPEYNYSVSGVLKNAIDWASRRTPDPASPLDGKPVAIMGAGGRFGTVQAQNHLRAILLHNHTYPLAHPRLMLARAYQYFDDDVNLVDEESRQRLRRLLQALQEWTQQLNK